MGQGFSCLNFENDFVITASNHRMGDSNEFRYPEEVQMKPRYASWGTCGIFAIALTVSSGMFAVPNAYPEAYIGGQFGVALPSIGGGLTNAEFNFSSPPFEVPDFPLKTSFLYGAKVGYYFSRASWFGLETEAYNTTPHMKQLQTNWTVPGGTVFPGPGGGTIPTTVSGPVTFSGNHLRVLMWAPVNLMFRYPHARVQPYVGVGPGIFFARINITEQGLEATQNNVRVGLNAKAGVEVFITRHIAVFGEYKYNWVRFNFDETLGIAATYNMHLVSGGLSYHF